MFAVFPEVNGPPLGRAIAALAGIPQGSINTTYKVTLVDGTNWFLRINENKPYAVIARERDLLAELARHDLGATTPHMARSVPGSAFYALDDDSGRRRWAAIFPQLPGRDLAPFEVGAVHTTQVGAFLARAHRAVRQWPAGVNRYGIDVVERWLAELRRHDATADTASQLQRALIDVRRHRRLLPRGTIHGDVFIDNTKWDLDGEAPRLRAVFDWEMAGRDHLMLDLAVTLCAWCWQRQGEAMVFRPEVAAALVAGYRCHRPLSSSEVRGLFVELQLAAVRFAASRLRDFAVPRDGPAPQRRVLDPADFVQRLEGLQGAGESSTLKALGLR
jgi:homoserine kinase type II